MTSILQALKRIQAKGEQVPKPPPRPAPPPPAPARQPALTTGNELFVGLHGIAPSVVPEPSVVPVAPDIPGNSDPPGEALPPPTSVPEGDARAAELTVPSSADPAQADTAEANTSRLETRLPQKAPSEAAPETHVEQRECAANEAVAVTEIPDDARNAADGCTELMDFGTDRRAAEKPADGGAGDSDAGHSDAGHSDAGDCDVGDCVVGDCDAADCDADDCDADDCDAGDWDQVKSEHFGGELPESEFVADAAADHEPIEGDGSVPPPTALGFAEQLRDVPAFDPDPDSMKTWILDEEPPETAESTSSELGETDSSAMALSMLEEFADDGVAADDDRPHADAGADLDDLRAVAEGTEEISLLDEIEDILLPEHMGLWSAPDAVDDLSNDDEFDSDSDISSPDSLVAAADNLAGSAIGRGFEDATQTATGDSAPAAEAVSDTFDDEPPGDAAEKLSGGDASPIEGALASGLPGGVAMAPDAEGLQRASSASLPSGTVARGGLLAMEISQAAVAAALSSDALVEFASPAHSLSESVMDGSTATLDITDFELEICGNLNQTATCHEYDDLWSRISARPSSGADSATSPFRLSTWFKRQTPVQPKAEEATEIPRSVVFGSVEVEPQVANVLAHLAIYLTTRCKLRVLLVDANLDGATLTERFAVALPGRPGIAELCLGEIGVPAVFQTATGVAVVSVGADHGSDVDFQPGKLIAFMTSQSADYDIILVDGGASDRPLFYPLAESCDRSYLLAHLGKTEREAAAARVKAIVAAGVPLSGCVIANAPAAR